MKVKNNKVELRTINYGDFKFDDNKSNVTGYVNHTGVPSQPLGDEDDQFIEIMKPGVFSDALKEADFVDFYYEHDSSKVLATTQNDSLTLGEDNTGLKISADIVNTSWGQDAYNMIKDGMIKGMSFGMIVLDDSWDLSNEIPVRTINKIMLFEVSAVRFPAYPDSSIESRNLKAKLESRGLNLVKNIKIPKKKEVRNMDENNVDSTSINALTSAADALTNGIASLTDAMNNISYSISKVTSDVEDRSEVIKRDKSKDKDEVSKDKEKSKKPESKEPKKDEKRSKKEDTKEDKKDKEKRSKEETELENRKHRDLVDFFK